MTVSPDDHADLFRQLFEINPLPMWVYDVETMAFLTVNAAAVTCYGYAHDEFQRMTLRDIRPESEIPRLLENAAHVRYQPQVACTSRHRRKDGSLVDVEISSTALLYQGREARLVIASDITEREETLQCEISERCQAEEALRDSEERYRRVFEQSRTVNLLIDLDSFAIVDANPSACRFYGYSLEQFRRMSVSDINGLNLAQNRRKFAKYLDELGKPICLPHRLASGEIRQVEARPCLIEVGGRKLIYSIITDVTEQRQAEERLKESEERFRSMVQALGEGLIITDLDDTILYVNSRMAQMSSYAPETMVGRPAYELLLPPEEWQPMRERNAQRACDISERYEIAARHSDGRQLWLEVHATPFRNAAGEIVGTLSANIDITARKQAEAALQSTQVELQIALQTGGMGTWTRDCVDGKVSWSEGHEKLFGLPAGAFCGKYEGFVEYVHPDDRHLLQAGPPQAGSDDSRFNLEFRTIWPDGSVHWLSSRGQFFFDSSGKPVRISGATMDITARKLVEAALQESEMRLRALVISLDEIVFEFDAQGVYRNVWTNNENLLARPKAEMIGRRVAEIIGKKAAAPFVEAFQRVIARAQAEDMEYCLDVPDGRVWFLARISPVHAADGSCQTVSMLARNITERKRLESERERLLADAIERADHDPLTGLLNHRAFHKRLEEEADRAKRQGTRLAIAVVDMDNFKFFNDAYGHIVGDDVLRLVARALQRNSRSYDTLARYGGDEFAILMPEVQSGETLEERLVSGLAGLGYQPPGHDSTIPLTLSHGVALFPDDAPTRLEALTLADARLRTAKTGGRDSAREAEYYRATLAHSVDGFSMLDALVAAVDNKDRYTRRHSEDVLCYSLEIARALGLDEETQRTVAIAALLHDVGKIGVPDHILRKPGTLSADEYQAIQQHPMMGAVIVGAVPGFEATLDAIRHHHERWDGAGYPFGLRGLETPLLARLMAVADAFSAMTTDRPYRKGMLGAKALTVLEEGAGSQWDPDCVAAFLSARQARHQPVLL